ncbi:MAG: hypothetical protein IBX72_06265 [Nitrospirae bacterium]|nr:hypothetical protein [Nitrospirota bacterium]
MKELTDKQIERQDFVDNAIFNLIQSLNTTDKTINWDIEMIGEIRDVIAEWMIERLNITDEQKFYPYLEH